MPVPKISAPERKINKTENFITVPFSYKDIGLKYNIDISPGEKGSFTISIDFEKIENPDRFEEIAFSMDFYPEAFAGKSYLSENDFGVLPFDFVGDVFSDQDQKTTRPFQTGHYCYVRLGEKSGRICQFRAKTPGHRAHGRHTRSSCCILRFKNASPL